MSLHVVRAGIDWLEVSLAGSFSEEIAERLDALKTLAQDRDRAQPFGLGPFEMLVQPKAFGMWRWRLVNPEFDVTGMRLCNAGGVCGSVRLSAFGLANSDSRLLWTLVQQSLAELGTLVPFTVSRVDVAVDFQGLTPTPELMSGMVCPASYRATHGTALSTETFQYGKGAVVLRVYDKSSQTAARGITWWPDAWRLANGFDPELPVWRAEVQLRRQALSELGIDSPEQVFRDPGAILDYGLRWAQLRVPSTDTNKTRWEEYPEWTKLREAVFGGFPIGRIVKPSALMSLDRTMGQYLGAVATAAAYFGTTEYLSAAQQLSLAAEVHMMNEKIDFAGIVESKRRRIMSGEG